MPDSLLEEIDPEVCTVPEGALTANDVLAAAVLTAQVGSDSRTAALRAFAFALDVTLPVARIVNEVTVVYCGVLPGETGTVEGDRRRAVHNHQAMQRLMELVTESGGGRVRLPDLRYAPDERPPADDVPWASNRTPVLWLGPLGITEGVEFVLDGWMKVPTGGLHNDTFLDANGVSRKVKQTCLTFASGIRSAAITGAGILDGNARGNITTIPMDWLQSVNDQTGEVNYSESGPASCRCNGVVWGPGDDRIPDDEDRKPPEFVRVEGITSVDHLRNCFVGALTNVRLANVSGGRSWTDHIYYFSTGTSRPDARTFNGAVGATNLDAFGFWRGGAVSFADGVAHGLTVRDVASNPVHLTENRNTGADGTPTPFLNYARRKLGNVIGPRPHKVGGAVTGLSVFADLSLLTGVVGLRGRGFTVEGIVYHTGGPEDYYTDEGDAPSPTGIPCTLVDVGPAYGHVWPRGCRVQIRAHRLPGRTELFDNKVGPVYDLTLDATLDYHPQTTTSGDLVTLRETAENVRIHVEAWERAPFGGGPGRLLRISNTTVGGTLKTDPPPDEWRAAPTPPARGVHGVEVSGRANVARGLPWMAFGEPVPPPPPPPAPPLPAPPPIVTGLVARDLTVVSSFGPNQVSDFARWRHERVRYLTPRRTDAQWAAAWQSRTVAVTGPADAVETTHGEAGPPDVVEVGKVERTTGGATSDLGIFGTSPELDAADQTAVLHVEPSDALTRVGNNVSSSVSFDVRAERYNRAPGDVDDVKVPVLSALGEFHAVAHGLAAAPSVVEAWWIDGGSNRRQYPAQTELRSDAATTVWVRSSGTAEASDLVHLRARIG